MLCFFSTALVDQIRTIKKTSEARLEMMKKEVISVEAELEEVRYTASLAGVTTNKEYKKQLGEKQQKLRQVKEKTEAIEQLQQRVVAGLAHISDILFIPKSEDDAPVSDLHKNIEAVLDTLINEREKQLQQQQQGQAQGGQVGVDSQSKMANTRDSGSVVSTPPFCLFIPTHFSLLTLFLSFLDSRGLHEPLPRTGLRNRQTRGPHSAPALPPAVQARGQRGGGPLGHSLYHRGRSGAFRGRNIRPQLREDRRSE